MKTAYIIITALAIALAVVTYKLVETSSAEPHADAVTAATSKASSAASENLLLAANALGLGAVWCGVYPVAERVTFVRSLLGLPSDLIPLNIIPIGYPKAEATPKQKYDPANIINR